MAEEQLYVLWGSRGHSKVIADVIESRGGTVIALVDNDADAEPSLSSVPLLIGINGLSSWLNSVDSPASVYRAAVTIGGSRGQDRRVIAEQLSQVGLALPPIIHLSASVSPRSTVGEGSQILANAVVAADAVIGRLCIINNSVNVDHECQIDDGVHIAPGAVLCGCVEVGENAMIGAGSVILPRRRIGMGALVGAGAVVTHDVPARSVVIGNPAREIRREQ